MDRKKISAYLAAFGATLIYGLNHTIAKVIMPDYIGASGFIMLRLLGAGLLFWTVSFFLPKESIQSKTIYAFFLLPFWECVSICSCSSKDWNYLPL